LELGAFTQEDISKCLGETGLDETDEAYQLSFNVYSEFADRIDECIDIAKLDSGIWARVDSGSGILVFFNALLLRNFDYVGSDDNVEKAYAETIEFRLLQHCPDCSCGGWRYWRQLFKAEGRWHRDMECLS